MDKARINKNIDYIILTIIGILSFLYTFYYYKFAELCIEIPGLDFPIFPGEIALGLCLLLFFFKYIFLSDRIKPTRHVYLLIAFYIFIITKALYGYSKCGPLALRNAALFYYSLYAVIGYCSYRNDLDLFKDRFVGYSLLLFFAATVIFTWSFKTHYIYYVIFTLVILSGIKPERIRYVCIALFPLFGVKSIIDTILRGRDITVASFFSYIFLFFFLILSFIKLERSGLRESKVFRYRKQLASAAIIFVIASLAYFWVRFDRDELGSLLSVKNLLSDYTRFSKVVEDKKENFKISNPPVKIYEKPKPRPLKLQQPTFSIPLPQLIPKTISPEPITEPVVTEEKTASHAISMAQVDTQLMPMRKDEHNNLILHYDITSDTNAFIDSSLSNHKITVYGDTQIDTTQSKFGGASAFFDGAGDYLSLNDSNNWYFGTGKFTIDFWVRLNSVLSTQTFISQWTKLIGEYGYGTGWIIWWDHTAKTFNVSSTRSDQLLLELSCDWSPQTNTWYHITVIRNGITPYDWYIFVNGVRQQLKVCMGSENGEFVDLNQPLFIGWNGFRSWFNGWIDELRIYKGIARWKAVGDIPMDILLAKTDFVYKKSPKSDEKFAPVIELKLATELDPESQQPINTRLGSVLVMKVGGRPEGVCRTNVLFRIFMWQDIFEELLSGMYIFGVDFGNPFRSRSLDILNWAASWKLRGGVGWLEPHNSYIHILYRTGVVGLLFIVTIWVLFFRMSRSFIRNTNIKGIILASLVLYWLVVANFSVILELPYFAIPFWCTFGIVLKYAELSKLKQ